MTYFFIGGFALLAALAAYGYLRKIDRRLWMRSLRYLVAGLAGLAAVGLMFARRFDIAIFVGVAAVSILRTGRLGPITLDDPTASSEGSISRVKSRYFAMQLDHDTGTVEGRVLAGRFAGADLMELDEDDTRFLITEIEGDTDSLSLLESWLDANRAGWREYFAGEYQSDEPAYRPSGNDAIADAYAVLGLKPGASEDEIRTAHRELMKAVHPDHGGSSYLASKINEARDTLLKR